MDLIFRFKLDRGDVTRWTKRIDGKHGHVKSIIFGLAYGRRRSASDLEA